jgi:hypothetical protein
MKPDEAQTEQVMAWVDDELRQGKAKKAIVQELVRNGWPEDNARQVVREVVAGKKAAGSAGGLLGLLVIAGESPAGDFAVGAVALAIGVLATAGTYAAAAPGEAYIIWFGPVVFGLFRVLRGASRLGQ